MSLVREGVSDGKTCGLDELEDRLPVEQNYLIKVIS